MKQKQKQNLFSRKRFILLAAFFAVVCCVAVFLIVRAYNDYLIQKSLPDISYFKTHKSDQFLVDMDVVKGGSPYMGKRAVNPHTGGHVVFGDDYSSWPKGGNAPQDYPPIYAVADGVITGIENKFDVGNSDKYHINLAIAKGVIFEYSIEPFIKEPADGFYKKFIDVKLGQRVKKGQVIAHMYLPKNISTGGTHIHFDLRKGGKFMAPAIFTPQIDQEFHDLWGNFGTDGRGAGGQGTPIPVCMGWKLSSAENPYGNDAVDCLN